MTLPAAKAIKRAYFMFTKEAPSHQARLRHLCVHFQKRFQVRSESPIFSLLFPKGAGVKEYARMLRRKGFAVNALVPPTTPLKNECIKIVLHSFNTVEEIDRLKEELSCVLSSLQA